MAKVVTAHASSGLEGQRMSPGSGASGHHVSSGSPSMSTAAATTNSSSLYSTTSIDSTPNKLTQSEDRASPSSKKKGISEGRPTSPQTPARPSIKTRTRSTSSSMLARLTSRTPSFHSTEQVVAPGSPTSTIGSLDGSGPRPKIDRAALTKARGKYKSGINWDASPMNLAADDEPFMEQAGPIERTEEEVHSALKEAELEAMAAAGSTKAALARANHNSIGAPVFATYQRAMAEASSQAAMAAAAAAASSAAASTRGSSMSSSRLSMPRLSAENGKSASVRFNGSTMNGITEDADSKAGDSREGSQGGDHLISDAAQAVLDQTKGGKDGAESSEQTIAASPAGLSTPTSKDAKRRTFLGFVMKELKGNKKGKDDTQSEEGSGEATEDPKPEAETKQTEREEQSPGEANGTQTGRRRRFNDTRQLHLLASELAAEALLGAPDSPPTVGTELRRGSLLSSLAASNAEFGAASSNASQISLGQGGIGSYSHLAGPMPAFAADAARGGASGTGTPRTGSPRTTVSDFSRFEPPRAPFARSQHSLSTPSSPQMSQKSKLTGLPTDMLTGLGDGPYPTLLPRGLDLPDPFGPGDGPDDNSLSGRNSIPDTFSRSRGGSSSSAHLPRRSVLQMSMHNPEAELQGLTKLPKSGKSTPFGSRAPSKQVTPASSYNNLKEKVALAASVKSAPQVPLLPTADVSKPTGDGDSVSKDAILSTSNDIKPAEEHSGKMAQTAAPTSSRPTAQKRRSFFGRKSKKEPEAAPALPSSKTQSLQLPNGQSASGQAMNGDDRRQRSRSASRSTPSLVMVPSPTQSNTTSASSHEPGALAYSSDGGGSQRQGLSAVTTPEALPANFSISSSEHAGLPSKEVEKSTGLASSAIGQAQRPSGQTTPSSRLASSASKATTTGSVRSLGRFKAMFGSGTKDPSTQSLTQTPKAVPIKNYSRQIKPDAEKVSVVAPTIAMPSLDGIDIVDGHKNEKGELLTHGNAPFSNFRANLSQRWLA